MRFLIIDDSDSITEALQIVIHKAGHDCVIESDGERGLHLIKEEKWDAILLDLSMPGFSGLDVLKDLEKENKIKESKIIIFTASSMSDEKMNELHDRGIHSYIRKPCSIDTLTEKLGLK